ncbi:LUD domain-containing protein [Janibacter alkaliphilus]|uniref:L-lactate dehydrogenase complex protein LldG n=1 Tax=Janibacter alkaliphilus TaxID=1069963 RepID=A0A852X3M9_9MICO|nr:L-lactate dehydrogenase complex protein LldG [Janibacter alkaliphilus]
MNARDEVLASVRAALGGRERPQVPVDRGYRQRTVGAAGTRPAGSAPTTPAELVDLFADRVADYRAEVVRCAEAELGEAVAVQLAGVTRVVVPAGLGIDLAVGSDVEVLADDGLSRADLDATGAVVTTATVGIAETGTIVLDHGPGQGRRALTLLPDRHVCVVREDQVVVGVVEAVAALDPARPQTWISGPSATSDIELSRVEGVHGPRDLRVVVVGA